MGCPVGGVVFENASLRTFHRHAVIITMRYLHSHCTWERLCQTCIGSSFLPHGAFPEGGAYGFSKNTHAGSLEALRVTRPEAVAS